MREVRVKDSYDRRLILHCIDSWFKQIDEWTEYQAETFLFCCKHQDRPYQICLYGL